MKIRIVALVVIFFMISGVKAQQKKVFKDKRDGKIYKTVEIANQVWLAENLAYKTKSDCWAYEDKNENKQKYGYLYTWEMAKNACPSGWHLPSNEEWNKLINVFGGKEKAGKFLKEKVYKNVNGTVVANKYAFNLLLVGKRNSLENGSYNCESIPKEMEEIFSEGGLFSEMGEFANYWTVTEINEKLAYWVSVSGKYSDVYKNGGCKKVGFSVRCVKNK